METVTTGYSRVHRAIEIAAIALWLALSASLARRLALELDHASVTHVLVGCAIGYVGADFASGLVHWLADTWGDAEMPVLGSGFIRPFREHHVDPRAIGDHDFIETNGNSAMGAVLLLLTGYVLPEEGSLARGAQAAVLSLATSLVATNQIHKWAHADVPPTVIAWLQRRGWILSPAHHALHHTHPFDGNYCITSGWLNPLLGRTHFFARLERWITAASGAVPRRSSDLR